MRFLFPRVLIVAFIAHFKNIVVLGTKNVSISSHVISKDSDTWIVPECTETYLENYPNKQQNFYHDSSKFEDLKMRKIQGGSLEIHEKYKISPRLESSPDFKTKNREYRENPIVTLKNRSEVEKCKLRTNYASRRFGKKKDQSLRLLPDSDRIQFFGEPKNYRKSSDFSENIKMKKGEKRRKTSLSPEENRSKWDNTFNKFLDTPDEDSNPQRDREKWNRAKSSPSRGWAKNACPLTRRVAGGWSPTSIEQFPYMVHIDVGCGGAIISDRWVITAAHCVDQDSPRSIHVGSLDLQSGCRYGIKSVHVHPKFTREKLQYDIALLKIQPKFRYSAAIQPVKLSKTRARYKMCGVVTGWGAEVYEGPPNTHLLMAMIPVVAKRKCAMFNLKKGQFCAGYKDGTSDSCQGDSGGPFVVQDLLVGTVSFGFKCAASGTPGVYVDIFYHRRWIKRVSGIK